MRKRGEKRGGRGEVRKLCWCACVKVRKTSIPRTVFQQDLALIRINMFQYDHVFVHYSRLFWAASTKSSSALMLLTLFSHITMQGGLGFFQCNINQTLVALGM